MAESFVCYFDEVKPDERAGRHSYIVGGIVVPLRSVAELEGSVSDLSRKVFGTAELTKKTEFHSKEIYYGKGSFKGMDVKDRLEILRNLTEIISDRDITRLVYSCIRSDKLYPGVSASEHAFMHFMERCENAVGRGNTAIAIGDLDHEQMAEMIADFLRFREDGTNSVWGRKIERIVDSIHFAQSHHSRMIQLADNYVFNVSGLHNPRTGWMADEHREQIRQYDLFPTSYKIWPNS